jgi:hypothetical protein
MSTVEEIEFKYELEYTNETKEKYSDIIVKIFNHEDINIEDDPEIKIIKAHYYIKNDVPFKGEQLLLELADRNYLDGIHNLAVFYYSNNDYENAMKYLKIGTDQHYIKSTVNLAYLYYLSKDFEAFLKYNKIGIDNNYPMAFINMGLYLWNIVKDEKEAFLYLNKLSSHESFFTIAKLLNEKSSLKNRDMIIFNCIKALQLRIEKSYINLLNEHTTTLERYFLYKEHNINIETEIKTIDSYCPVCLNYKNLLELICKHSICLDCLKQTKIKTCLICSEFI